MRTLREMRGKVVPELHTGDGYSIKKKKALATV